MSHIRMCEGECVELTMCIEDSDQSPLSRLGCHICNSNSELRKWSRLVCPEPIDIPKSEKCLMCLEGVCVGTYFHHKLMGPSYEIEPVPTVELLTDVASECEA